MFVFSSLGVFSQKMVTVDYNTASLREVLLDLESKTDLTFSFAENAIADKFITFTSSGLNETELLSELTAQTGLIFEKVSESQVIVSVPSTKMDVCGYLFDSDTSTPLPYATVVLAGTTNGTITDGNGFFQIQDVEQSQSQRKEYVEFANKTLKVSDYVTDDCKNIIMLPETQSLEEVVVLAYLTTGIDKNTDGSFTLNNAKQGILPGLVEPDVFQSIQLIPGITSLDESAAGIQIRGGSPDQNLIFLDGIKMYNTGHFFGMISAFNPYVTESAKIY